jgi:hypothetical protein
MTRRWMTIALSCTLAAACGDRPAETQQNTSGISETAAPADAPVTPATPPQDAVPGAPEGQQARATQRRPSASQTPTNAGHHAADPVGDPPRIPAAAPVVENRSPAAPVAPRFREVTLAAGTVLRLELMTGLSSESAGLETPVRARLTQPLVVDGLAVLPAGTVLTGHVTDVARAGRVQGRARLAFAFTEAIVDGAREDVRTNTVTVEAEATRGEDATKIGAGAGVGAIIGGIVGGGSGAAKGAAIGGAAGTGAVLATRGREVELATGTDLLATLASPVTLRIEGSR